MLHTVYTGRVMRLETVPSNCRSIYPVTLSRTPSARCVRKSELGPDLDERAATEKRKEYT